MYSSDCQWSQKYPTSNVCHWREQVKVLQLRNCYSFHRHGGWLVTSSGPHWMHTVVGSEKVWMSIQLFLDLLLHFTPLRTVPRVPSGHPELISPPICIPLLRWHYVSFLFLQLRNTIILQHAKRHSNGTNAFSRSHFSSILQFLVPSFKKLILLLFNVFSFI